MREDARLLKSARPRNPVAVSKFRDGDVRADRCTIEPRLLN
ncbi:hypothetical protein I552_3779 [Mycobacterium xenopi 3993]|nr:hypothetical protein I552_3779 [Mycobacterium xenopi 3993]